MGPSISMGTTTHKRDVSMGWLIVEYRSTSVALQQAFRRESADEE